MRNLLIFFFLIIAISISSCRKDFSTIPSFGNLEFSRDTIFLDTIFTNIGSATYNLKVYNKSNSDITIPNIALERGTTSNYRLNVDGIPGKSFDNIDILTNDSIFVFVETTIDFNAVPDPLYTDRILFDTGINQQDVDLVTLVQDATFIFPDRDPISMQIDSLTLDGQPTTIQGRFLEDSELIFTNARPYVIYGYAAVPANKTLRIEAGARIHFHDNSGLIIDRGATLLVQGTQEEKVVFEGDRLENTFSNIPGQWGTIWMRAGSIANEMKFAKIKNVIFGILTDSIATSSPSLTMRNTEIFNHSNFGVLARESSIVGENVVIGNAGEASFAGVVGGSYDFTHSTFANYWNNGIRALPTVLMNNFFTRMDGNGQEIVETRDLTKANFTNCLIDGNNNIEFVPDKIAGSVFNFKLTNTMFRFEDLNNTFDGVPEVDFTDINFYENIVVNGFSNFRNTAANDFIIGPNSDAIGKGNQAAANQVPTDILGVLRTTTPDLGAYQHIIFD